MASSGPQQLGVIGLGRMGADIFRGLDDFANKALSAMRKGFGGHDEKKD
ncbi:MAG: hypothetical protein JWN03_4226 [Nocardia sp.]|nr:hypothetical protein [Nocardia sp.]